MYMKAILSHTLFLYFSTGLKRPMFLLQSKANLDSCDWGSIPTNGHSVLPAFNFSYSLVCKLAESLVQHREKKSISYFPLKFNFFHTCYSTEVTLVVLTCIITTPISCWTFYFSYNITISVFCCLFCKTVIWWVFFPTSISQTH